MRWKRWEVEYLAAHAADGAEAVAERLGKSPHAVETKASREGISMRKAWHCPRCGRKTYLPLSPKTGWCRLCAVEDTKAKAMEDNAKARRELAREMRAIAKAERERQNLYSNTCSKRKKLRRLSELREANEKWEGEAQ